jgi:4-hydroxybenzoate polyprenyltransferase
MSSARAYLKLARPKQWAKNVFVLLGPLYGLRDHPDLGKQAIIIAALTAASFSVASSAVYVVNDIMDAEKDRHHPRKSRRPIASGAISKNAGWVFAACLAVAGFAATLFLPHEVRWAVLAVIAVYVFNVTSYSMVFKHIVVLDVLSLSLGFVLRVVGGCVAVAIAPSTWLLNVTFFLAMFLAFGKRLGERRTLGESAGNARDVQLVYTDEILRMFVVVTAVATLLIYAFYVQSRDVAYKMPLAGFPGGVNVLWLTMIPATYAMARAIVLLERGDFDDPTEMAAYDPPMQAAVVVFGLLSGGAMLLAKA